MVIYSTVILRCCLFIIGCAPPGFPGLRSRTVIALCLPRCFYIKSRRVNDFLCTPPSVIITHGTVRPKQNISFRYQSVSDPVTELRMTTSWDPSVVNDVTSDKADLSNEVKLSVPNPDCSFHGSISCVAMKIM